MNSNFLMPVTERPPEVFVRGQGDLLWDSQQQQYLDFVQGWAVNCLGHCHPLLIEALQAQSALLINASPAFYNQPVLELAQYVTGLAKMQHVFFGSSGAEANEGAIKLARKYGSVRLGGAYEIISTWNSFHGRTLATMAATGKKAWQGLFAPRPEGFIQVDYNDITAVEAAISSRTCAVLVEPIQGEAGVIVPSATYLQELRELCTKHNILLIADEIQTGVGRTGKVFAVEHCAVKPDIMTLGKGLGGGYPFSALLTKEHCSLFEKGEQGGTFSGQPLGASVALAVLKHVSTPDFLATVQSKGQYLAHELNLLPKISAVRGQGLLIGCTIEQAPEIVKRCRAEQRLLINAPNPNTLRFMPALTVEQAHLEQMLHKLATVIKAVLGS